MKHWVARHLANLLYPEIKRLKRAEDEIAWAAGAEERRRIALEHAGQIAALNIYGKSFDDARAELKVADALRDVLKCKLEATLRGDQLIIKRDQKKKPAKDPFKDDADSDDEGDGAGVAS